MIWLFLSSLSPGVRKLKKFIIFFINLFLFAGFSLKCPAADKILVFAASSTTKPLQEIISIYNREKPGNKIIASFASSSALARQIENGAPAAVFLSANPEWMDYLNQKNLIDAKSRKNFLGNSLVIVANKNEKIKIKMAKGFNFTNSFSGKIALADPQHVPAGIYARQGLEYFGWWKTIEAKIVATMDVKAALNLVEKDECPVGIVYASDTKFSENIKIIGRFPEESHEPVIYPVALLKNSPAAARDFFNFLFSKKAEQIFLNNGFSLIAK
jgi:molybdate transport system substrate-binding protein